MSALDQQELKTQGNAALSNGDAVRALELFSRAIDLNTGDAASRAILYSNRAACQMKLGGFEEALADAESCIRLDKDFPKGWSRKASALFSLGRLSEAKECFETAATKARTETDAKTYREWAQRCSDKLPSSRQTRPTTEFIELLPVPVILFRIASLFLALVWLVTADAQWYLYSMLTMLVAVTFQVALRCGRPRLSTAYLETVVRCDVKPSFYLALAFASLVPNMAAVLSIQAYDLVALVRSLNVILSTKPHLVGRFQTLVQESPLLDRVLQIEGWKTMNVAERFRRVDVRMEELGTRFQLSVLLVLLIQLFTAAASPISLILYTQVLKLRYLSHAETKNQMHTVDNYLTALSQRNAVANKAYLAVRNAIVFVMKPRQ